MTTERRIVFGTAGHVDHGKSMLVKALTGTDPDRWAEEKAREMTIDLGFAFLELPGFSEPVAIVDVPGHEMFVRNMVAGATGIDAAIFVVAADEGVMPQTREHLDVLRYLRVRAGVVALTKIDRVTPERVDEVQKQVAALLAGTLLEGIPFAPVSARTGEGIDALKKLLQRVAENIEPRSSGGVFRLPIDRVFTLKGVGTVITGTVVSGSLEAGETVSALPLGRDLRTRSLQVHDRPVKHVSAGQRAAVNLADVAKEELHRGDALATPGAVAPTSMMDVRLHLSRSASKPLRQRARLRVHHASKEVMARAVLLEMDALTPGSEGIAQLRLEAPLIAMAGDLFVIRSYSPMRVIGGGQVIDPHPPKRRRRDSASDVLSRESLTGEEVLVERLDRAGAVGAGFEELRVAVGMDDAGLRSTLEELQADKRAVQGRKGLWLSAGAVEEMQAEVVRELDTLHARNPLRTWIELNALASRVVKDRDLNACFRLALEALEQAGKVRTQGEGVRLVGREPEWRGPHATAREKILETCDRAGLAGPSDKELSELTGLSLEETRRVLAALADAGELCALAPSIYVLAETMDRLREKVREHLERQGRMTIGQARDLLGASRKYLLPFLERLDREGLTVRRGDYRELLRQR